jgi:hypothetical protein
MNSTESVIPTGNNETIATGPSIFDLLSGCIVLAMQQQRCHDGWVATRFAFRFRLEQEKQMLFLVEKQP